VRTNAGLRARSPEARARSVIRELRARANPANVAGMARYGINPVNTLGVSAPDIWEVVRAVGRDHDLALALWDSAIHDARHVAAAVDEPERVSSAQMERWVKDLDSWDVCDGVCGKLFDKTPHAWRKAAAWTKRREEFVRRAGFVLMAALAVHDKEAPDDRFLAFFPLIERGATDERNFVRKAVNWALRQIGKRNLRLNRAAVAWARRIRQVDSPSARWIAADALRELTSPTTSARLVARQALAARRAAARRRGPKA
jgi:3-methyladenine DNA glycosylase AlkD